MLNNIQNIFKIQKSPYENSVLECKRCKRTWNIDDKEYRLKFSKKNMLRCMDNKCYTQQLEGAGLQFDDLKKLVSFFKILGTGKKRYYEEIAICLQLPSSCAASVPSEQKPEKITVRPIESLNPLYDFQSEISQKIYQMLEKYDPDNSKAIVALPTGSGKTRLVVETLTDWINLGKPGVNEYKRFILWVVERQELCWQAYKEFQNVFTNKGKDINELRLYPYWDGTSKNIHEIFETEGDVIIVASKDSLDRKTINQYRPDIRELGKRCSIVIVDEAHRATAPGYIRLMTALGFRMGKAHPDETILLGLTATPFKGKKTSELERRFGNQIFWPTLSDDATSNQKPVPILEIQEQAIENQSVRIHGERSFDKDGTVGKYNWKIQKDDQNLEVVFESETKENNLKFEFTEPGKYKITLEVSDDEGIRSETPAVQHITVLEAKPPSSESNAKQMQKLYRRLMTKRVLSKVNHRILGYAGVIYENVTISEADYEDISDDNIREMGEDPERNNMLIEELRHLVLEEGKKSILFFGCSIEHSREIAIRLNAIYGDEGIVAEDVYGETNYKRRKDIVKQFKEQKINVLCNFGLFTTGFDVPKIDCIFIGRPTFSLLLYTQMIGRGLRGPKNLGTEDCLVVDTDEQYQNYIVEKQDVSDLEPDEIGDSEEDIERAWRIFDDLWIKEEKKYWYDGKFHKEPPPDSVKLQIKKVNFKKGKVTTPLKYEWKCSTTTCSKKGKTKTKAEISFTSRIFGIDPKNKTSDNPFGFYSKCLECRHKSQKWLGECKFLIKKYQNDGSLFLNQIHKLDEFFKKYPEDIKKWQKTYQYVSEKLEEKKRKQNEDAKRNIDDVSITYYDEQNEDE